MSNLNINLPNSLHKMAKEVAKKEQITINQFIATALAEKISALVTEAYLEKRAKLGSRKKFEKVLRKVADREPDEQDQFKDS